MPFKSGNVPWNKGKRDNKIVICPTCNNKIRTRYDGQVYCNQRCYSKSPKLKRLSKKSYLILNNKKKRWRKGTGGKGFVNKTTFKKRDPRILGKNNPRWKGGITKFQEKVRKLPEYSLWRKNIFKRDNWTCQICGIKGCKLEAHHIKEFNLILKTMKILKIKEAIKCSELWNTNNGVTVCLDCHNKTKTKYFKIRNGP